MTFIRGVVQQANTFLEQGRPHALMATMVLAEGDVKKFFIEDKAGMIPYK